MPGVLLAELTREEIRQIAPNATVIIPTAAIEQHGPHLPIITDTLLVGEVARRSAEVASRDVPVFVAPTLPYGISAHHRPFPGVLSLNINTFVDVLRDLGESLAISGFKRVFILNGHGGNDEAVRLVTRDIGLMHNVLAGAASYWTLAAPALRSRTEIEKLGSLPGHAGAFETALVHAVRPDLVQKEMPAPGGAGLSNLGGAAYFSVSGGTNDGINGGYTDDPSRATADHGSSFLDIIAEEVGAALVHFHRSL